MRVSGPLFVGVDVGASRTKLAILDQDGKLIARAVKKSGIDFANTVDVCLNKSLKMAASSQNDIVRTIATGYGRTNVDFAQETVTEIGCHAKGCYHYFPMEITIIDIGGQDNKIIKLDKNGKRSSFKMNRKCAAGTGAFLEEMSMRLDIPIEEMNDLAEQSKEIVELGSFCTVFSATEVLEKIRRGKKVADIVKGLFLSVIKRILEMDSLTDKVVLTGGVVAHNPILVQMIEEIIGRKVLVPEHPQFTGAIGAALLAQNSYEKNK